MLPVELYEELLVEEEELERDAEDVEDCVEQAVLDSDLL
jgi:hypothetical protein